MGPSRAIRPQWAKAAAARLSFQRSEPAPALARAWLARENICSASARRPGVAAESCAAPSGSHQTSIATAIDTDRMRDKNRGRRKLISQAEHAFDTGVAVFWLNGWIFLWLAFPTWREHGCAGSLWQLWAP